MNAAEKMQGLIGNGVKVKPKSIPTINKSPPRVKEDDEVVTAERAIALSEDAIARRFADRYGGLLVFNHTSGRWHAWDRSRWLQEETDLAFDYARRLTRSLNHSGAAKWAKASVYAAVERIARADRVFARTIHDFDSDPWLLGTPGGILDLRTGRFSAPDPSAMISRATAVTPAAGVPTRWMKFLNQATGGDDTIIEFLQRLFGYSLTGTTTEQVLAFIYGPGGNGKGVLIEVVMRLFGDYAQSADMRTFTASRNERHSTELAAMRGARLVTASETEERAEWAESRIKQLTGGDVVRARFMRQDEFEFRPQFQLVIVGNHRPRLRNVTDAMRRRLRMIDFIHKPTKAITNLASNLIEREGAQILNWCIEGCLAWQRNGLPFPPTMRDITEAYFTQQDTFADWLDQACEVAPKFSCAAGALFGSWSAFCQSNGEEGGTQVRFAERLNQAGFNKRKGNGGCRLWDGLRLRHAARLASFHDEREWS